ncbi:hypothetical protein PR003_g3791 [Phytophthora rubi]|uniref:Protein kinase domain-containing protein n=1 Tax=Phytophthora rubi TaxID=129364 RepID=A0A6A4FXP3_9STRA|nr:hypothetical protein PR003_g3791 [Phytophthora rubi]
MTEVARLEPRRLQGLIGSIVNTVLGGGITTETVTPEPTSASQPVFVPTPVTQAPTPATEAPTITTITTAPTTRAPTTRKPVTRTPEPTTAEPTPSPTPSSTPEPTPEPVSSSSGSTQTDAPETPVPTSEANASTDTSLSSSADTSFTTDSSSGSFDDSIGSWSSSSSLHSYDLAASQDSGGQTASLGVNGWMVAAIALAAVAVVLVIMGLATRRGRRRDSEDEDSLAPSFQRHLNRDSKANVWVDTDNTRLDTSSTGPFTGDQRREHVNGEYSTSFLTAAQGDMWEDETITAMRIPLEKITRGKLLNRGGYGMVYHGSYRGDPVAIKTLLPEQRKTLRQINAFLSEIKMMAAMDHPRIVRLIGVAWDSLADLCCLSEYMEGGDLRSFLNYVEYQEHRPHGFDYEKSRIALHVAHSLTYLHTLDPQVLHRDLKSKNILLTENREAKITDFGVSRESSDCTMTAGVGTSLWMAPEVMMGERYGSSADIFSFGVVLSELDSHMLPYAETKETDSGRLIPDTALLQLVSVGLLRIEFSSHAPQALIELAHACVDLDPEARPTAGEVLYKLQLIMNVYESATL